MNAVPAEPSAARPRAFAPRAMNAVHGAVDRRVLHADDHRAVDRAAELDAGRRWWGRACQPMSPRRGWPMRRRWARPVRGLPRLQSDRRTLLGLQRRSSQLSSALRSRDRGDRSSSPSASLIATLFRSGLHQAFRVAIAISSGRRLVGVVVTRSEARGRRRAPRRGRRINQLPRVPTCPDPRGSSPLCSRRGRGARLSSVPLCRVSADLLDEPNSLPSSFVGVGDEVVPSSSFLPRRASCVQLLLRI